MTKLDFNDYLIEPQEKSKIMSREEILPLYVGEYFNKSTLISLPLIAAPMDTVVDRSNIHIYEELNIGAALPRGMKAHVFPTTGLIFESYSLYDFIDTFLIPYEGKKVKLQDVVKNPWPPAILIDIANGHMESLEETVRKAKKIYGEEMVLMVGNVANPKTYVSLSEAGADLIRIGIGNGNGCLTTQQSGVGYPMASLIQECYEESCRLKDPAKIVADGGMKNYSDIIKALGMGADFVMVGSIFNKALESAGQNYFWKIKVSQKLASKLYQKGLSIRKKFRGMSTKEVQQEWGKSKLNTSEGIVRYRNVEYTLPQWRENFEHYLKTAMSYCGCNNLHDFIGKVKVNQISEGAYERFKK